MFQLEQERVLSLDWVASYQGRLLQLERQSRHHAPAKSRVLVRENQTGELHIEYRGNRLRFTEIAQRACLFKARIIRWTCQLLGRVHAI